MKKKRNSQNLIWIGNGHKNYNEFMNISQFYKYIFHLIVLAMIKLWYIEEKLTIEDAFR